MTRNEGVNVYFHFYRSAYLLTFADLELPGVASDELEGDGEGTDVSDEGSPAFRLVALLFEVLTAFLAFTLAS